MRALFLTTLILLAAPGCRKNREVLLTRQTELDRDLAAAMATADRLNEHRRDLDTLDREVKNRLARFPEADVGDDEPLPVVVAPPTFPPLPPESAFEGAEEGARLRATIAATEARLAQLYKVVGEVQRIVAEKQRLQRQLDRVKQLEEQRR